MGVYSFKAFKRKIYLNDLNGIFSFDKKEVLAYEEIDIEEAFSNLEISQLNICICITNNCNLNCKYCFNKNKSDKNIDIDKAIELIRMLVSKYDTYQKFIVDVSGSGEPLLNLKGILRINDECKRLSNEINKEILVTFVSNGLLLVPKTANILQNAGVLFGVSLDANASNHNLNRNTDVINDSYDLIMENIKRIENKTYLGCAATISNNVFNLLDSLLELNKIFNTISVKPVRDEHIGFTNKIINKWVKEYIRVVEYIIDRFSNNDIKLLKSLLNGDDYLGKFIYKSILNIKTINRCDAGISRICISTDGELYGCAPATVYNELIIQEYNPKDALKKQIINSLSLCKGCKYYFLCGGQCEIETMMNDGRLNKCLCKLKKELINLSIYLALYCKDQYPNIYEELYSFCLNKTKRSKIDKNLIEFLNDHPDMSFTDGKKLFDELYPQY